MTRQLSLLISWACLAIPALSPVFAFFFLINIDAFASLAKRTLALPIQWQSVTSLQWYGLWLLTTLYLAVGWAGLYFLRRAFTNFAKGELFNQKNSAELRRFSILLFAQALAKPLHLALSSLLLSWHHPVGQKMLSLSFGSDEVKVIALAMILWVMSDLLIKGSQIENENKQFV